MYPLRVYPRRQLRHYILFTERRRYLVVSDRCDHCTVSVCSSLVTDRPRRRTFGGTGYLKLCRFIFST